MKAVSVLISAVLLTAIIVSAIALVLSYGTPLIEQSKGNLLFKEGINNLNTINNEIRSLVVQGSGSSSSLRLKITDGKYTINNTSDSITFVFNSALLPAETNYTEAGIIISSDGRTIKQELILERVDILNYTELTPIRNTIAIKNIGWNNTINKAMVTVS